MTKAKAILNILNKVKITHGQFDGQLVRIATFPRAEVYFPLSTFYGLEDFELRDAVEEAAYEWSRVVTHQDIVGYSMLTSKESELGLHEFVSYWVDRHYRFGLPTVNITEYQDVYLGHSCIGHTVSLLKTIVPNFTLGEVQKHAEAAFSLRKRWWMRSEVYNDYSNAYMQRAAERGTPAPVRFLRASRSQTSNIVSSSNVIKLRPKKT